MNRTRLTTCVAIHDRETRCRQRGTFCVAILGGFCLAVFFAADSSLAQTLADPNRVNTRSGVLRSRFPGPTSSLGSTSSPPPTESVRRSPFGAKGTTPQPMPGQQAYLRPITDVAVAAADMGILATVDVRRGQRVQRDQVLATLRDEVIQASLRSAEAAKEFEAAIEAARMEQSMRQHQFDGYQSLHRKGDLSAHELDRAEQNLQIATAKLDEKLESQQVKVLEHARVLEQIRSRQIQSPVDGIVADVLKSPGEFVSPTDPVVVRVIDCSRLRATFDLPVQSAASLVVGESVTLRLSGDREVVAEIEAVVPLIEPASGTMSVDVVVDNDDGAIIAGWGCHWSDPATTRPHAASRPNRTTTGRR